MGAISPRMQLSSSTTSLEMRRSSYSSTGSTLNVPSKSSSAYWRINAAVQNAAILRIQLVFPYSASNFIFKGVFTWLFPTRRMSQFLLTSSKASCTTIPNELFCRSCQFAKRVLLLNGMLYGVDRDGGTSRKTLRNGVQHHLRNDTKHWGWQRNQVHSLAQQLVQYDPVYYSLYVVLRPDHHWRLISYPYYAKHAMKANSLT